MTDNPVAEIEAALLATALDDRTVAGQVVETLEADAFTRTVHRHVWVALRDLLVDGQPTDPTSVLNELLDSGALGSDGTLGAQLSDLTAARPPVPTPDRYLTTIGEQARRRRLRNELHALTGQLDGGAHPDAVTRELDKLTAVDTATTVEPSLTLAAFLAADEPEHDWIVYGLVERGDRIILTGPEGGGKSTLLRQIAVQTAAGIHPFDPTADVDPIRVSYVDLENSARHVRRQLRPLVIQASDRLDLDLLDDTDAAWLTRQITANEPDLLVVGPLYKLATGDPTSEETARHVALQLDRLRTDVGCALLIEAHSPYGGSGRRPERPYGASLWSRWPEFGLHLTDTGALHHWRGARDERNWPAFLTRGGRWPWTTPEAPDEERWGLILDYADSVLVRPSVRQIADATGISRGTVHRTLTERDDEWEALWTDDDQDDQ